MGQGVIAIIGLLLALIGGRAEAAEKRAPWILDTGVHVSNVDQRIAHFSAPVSNITAYLRLRRSFNIKVKVWAFEPSLATTLPWRTNVDGNARFFTAQLSFDLVRALGSRTRLRFGTGIRSEIGASFGEAVILRNGSSTSTFYTPDNFVITNSLSANLGLEYALGKSNTLVVDVVVPSPLSTRRRVHLSVALGWIL